MPTDPSTIPGAFQYAGYWFLTDRTFMQIPNTVGTPRLNFVAAAGAEPRIPDLAGAPLASWLLARVTSMTRGRAPYAFDEVAGSDGDDFHLLFTCHQGDGTLVGSAGFIARHDSITLAASAVPPVDPLALRDALKRAVLASPHRVARSRITVVWTDGANDAARSGVPRVYGFDGGKYLDEIAPQHAIDWSEYD